MAGNHNSGPKKEKPFRDALNMEIAAAGEDRRILRVIARHLLKNAADGDLPSIKEVADRLDGKPAQESVLSGDAENPLEVHQTIELVDGSSDSSTQEA